MRIDGSCSLRRDHRSKAKPIRRKTQICHCTDCQTGTGSAFRVSIPVPGTTFKMTGQPTHLPQDDGGQRQSARAGVLPDMRVADLFDDARRGRAAVLYRAGRILRQRDQLPPRRQNWFSSARAWLSELPTIPKNEKQAG